MEKLKLDKIDKRLLSFIFHNFRTPFTQIAKACQISREQVEYRIKRYEKEGLISKYLTIFNLPALGYKKEYLVKIRVKNPKESKLSEISSSENILIFTRGLCYGKWDYILTVFTKEKSNILEFITNLYEIWGGEFLNYEIFEPIEIHWFPLKIFDLHALGKTLSILESEKIELDMLDKKILHLISKDAKIKLVKIAEKTDAKVKTIKYRLKKLEKNLILGYRLFLNLEVINYNLAQVNLQINDLSNVMKNKILNYAKQGVRIHSSIIGIGNFNLTFQIIYQTSKELGEEISKIKERFSDQIINYELVNIEKELEPTTFFYQ